MAKATSEMSRAVLEHQLRAQHANELQIPVRRHTVVAMELAYEVEGTHLRHRGQVCERHPIGDVRVQILSHALQCARRNVVLRRLDSLQKQIDFQPFIKRFSGSDAVRADAFRSFFPTQAVQRAYEEASFEIQGAIPKPGE
ncbi:MAG: hypothetical protein JJD97_04030 [Gemmatimonadaceae bacterium]|nr:hypothetical protein [Gemmatimonadaceae bacterium]